MDKRTLAELNDIFILVTALPAAASHDSWGRTDVSVPEPGAYLAAFILVPLFILAVWSLLHAASEQPAATSRSRRVRARGVFTVVQQLAMAFLKLF